VGVPILNSIQENDNVCELKGGFPVNGIASVNPMQRMGTSNLLYCVVLTMEGNGNEWNE